MKRVLVKVELTKKQAATIKEVAGLLATWDGLNNWHVMTPATRQKYERRAIELARILWDTESSIKAQVLQSD